ncbi:S41 family peptidase [Flavobacteriaceae bacterium F08102]|nr:S41 family peptidase [Flavobacteriaceae bacterium F08102]
MKNFLVTVTTFFLLTACSSVKKYNAQITTKIAVEDLQKDIDYTYRKLQKLHPNLDQYISKGQLEAKFDSLRKSIKEPLTGRAFFKNLAPVLFSIRQGHISIGPPTRKLTRKERKDYAKTKFELGQFKFEVLQKKLWIKAVFDNDTTLVGSQVLQVDGKPFKELLHKYKKQFASDGYNTTLYDRFVGARFAQMYLQEYGILDSVKLTLSIKDSVFQRTLRRIPKDSSFYAVDKKKLIFSDSLRKIKKELSKKELVQRKEQLKKEREYKKKHGYIKRGLYTRNFKFIDSLSQIGYMKIRHFSNGNYKKFYKETFAKLDSFKTSVLILDLRDNPGGRLAEIDKLYSYLALEDYQLINPGEIKTKTPFLNAVLSKNRPFLVRAFAVLFSPVIIPIELMHVKKMKGMYYYRFSSTKVKSPNALNFKGKLYVLINGNSFSASSIISTNLQATKRAVFVGEETGGAYNGTVAGLMKYVELPNSKVRMNFGMIQIESPFKTDVDGYGVKPDIKIIPTPADRAQGIDPELKWVLKNIQLGK